MDISLVKDLVKNNMEFLVPWDSVSRIKNLSITDLMLYKDKLNWELVSLYYITLNQENIEKYFLNYVMFYRIFDRFSDKIAFSEEFIEQNWDKFTQRDINSLCRNIPLPLGIIENHFDELPKQKGHNGTTIWEAVERNQTQSMTIEFINNHKSDLDLRSLYCDCKNKQIKDYLRPLYERGEI